MTRRNSRRVLALGDISAEIDGDQLIIARPGRQPVRIAAAEALRRLESLPSVGGEWC